MMRQTLLLITIIITTGVTLHAQKTEHNKSLLWEITGRGMQKPSYLFGTIHIICKNDYLWTPGMNNSMKNADEICMEMDMDDPTILMQIAYAMIAPDGKKLEEYFTKEDYQLVAKYFIDSLAIDIATFATMKPVVLQTLLTSTSFECDSSISYEVKLTEYAKEYHKEITGLESPTEQIKLLDQIPTDSVIKDLIALAKGIPDDETNYQALITAYTHQDLPQLYKLILKSKEQGDNMNAFLDERNKLWIDRMEEHMDQKSVFFAVGAGHLWGPNGLINLLRERGYTIRPIK